MTIADQELEIRARERIAFYGGGERGFVFFVNDGLDGARGDEIVVDVFDAGFVEFGICFSEGEGVFEEEWLVGFAGREVEGRGEGGGRSVDGVGGDEGGGEGGGEGSAGLETLG